VGTFNGQTTEFRVARTDGVVLHILSHQTLVAGPDGKASRLLAILQDVTERRQVQIALHESERRLRALLDAIPEEVRLKDIEGRYLRINRAAREYAGRTEAEIIGATIFDLRPPDIARQINQANRAALAAGQMTRVERRSFFEADGWCEIINVPIRDERGVISGLVSIGRDITERKKAKLDALREREERYLNVVEQAGDLIYRADVRGYFTLTNSTAPEDMLGYTRAGLDRTPILRVCACRLSRECTGVLLAAVQGADSRHLF
jgi:PAS domain S-box-containing protein